MSIKSTLLSVHSLGKIIQKLKLFSLITVEKFEKFAVV